MKKPEEIGAELSCLINGDVCVDVLNRAAFSTDASIYQIFPQCVAAPKNEKDLKTIVDYAYQNQIPIAPRGAGSGVAGESLTNGIVIDVRRSMNRILSTGPDGDLVTVQPGVVLDELNAVLASYGRKIGPDPSSSNRAVIGGVVANNATGAHSLRYGHISRYVQRIRGFLINGTQVELLNDIAPMESDSRPESELARKCSSLLKDREGEISTAQPCTERNRTGYAIQGIVHDGKVDLARLMAGSEGTLVIFSEITLKTVLIPKKKALVQFEFESFANMARAVPKIVNAGADACELMDQTLMTMARQAYPDYSDALPAGCAAALLVELTGEDDQQVKTNMERVRVAVGGLASDTLEVFEEIRQAKLWKARKDAVPLLNREKGPSHPIPFIEDVSVENAGLAQYISGLEAIGQTHGIPMAFYGHAGDGELHIRPYLDLSVQKDIEKMRSIANEVFELAWSLSGSISGEHAVGLVRSAFVRRQYGDSYYQLLKGIKDIFDPDHLLNPGKIINDDPEIMTRNLRVPAGNPPGGNSALLLGPSEFRFEAEQCSGCGVCLASAAGSRLCPVFRAMNEELASSRAKANLLRVWSNPPDSMEPLNVNELRRILSLCVNCKMCSIQCPAGVDVSKLVIEARAQLARQTGFTVTEMVLSHNRWLSVMASTFAPLSNWIMDWPVTRLVMEKVLGLDRNRRFPKFQRGSFVSKARRYLAVQPKIKNPVEEAAYFVDSFANWNDHDLGFSVIKLLRALNVEVVIPSQRPAPLPAYVYGNLKTARKDLEYNIRQFTPYVQQGYKIICSEPSAALCLIDELRYLVSSESARNISANAFELMDFLDQVSTFGKSESFCEDSKLTQTIRYAYHAPCHLQAIRGSQVSIGLLRRFGIEVMDVNGGCCGLAGTAGMQKKNRQMTEAIGIQLKKKIEAMAPDVVLTECAACGMQINHLTGIQVIHPVKVLGDLYLKEKE